MTSTTLTTELEAVNIILESCDEAPVASLDLSGLYPLDKAKRCLTEASRTVQAKGWEFNTEEGFTVSLDGTGQGTLPANTIRFNPDPSHQFDLIQRGLRLYNRDSHSYTLTVAPKGTAVWLLPWDELPEAARAYIIAVACALCQGRSSIPDSTKRVTEEEIRAAEAALSQYENESGTYNMLTDSWSCSAVLQGHY